ncbi:uncharacterized protein LOC120160577 [Hibiscus syriacus]|uniref:uncharacterized protein LOC120160577 n=1 Tax=Hibiscus syriacus TaxID=106335 RepID=UPI0019246208|nr:uncharacterized protein LOC120160577 [Hibiscus syriacus]
MAVSTNYSFPLNMEFKYSSLNPEAPEFFPANYNLVSAPGFPIFTPLLSSVQYPLAFSAPPFTHYQLEVEPQFWSPEMSVSPVAEPVYSMVEPLKDKMGLYRGKHHLKDKRHRKEGCLRADDSTRVARKKEWMAKRSNGEKVQDWTDGKRSEKHPLIPLKSDGKETTIMLKNIPIRYTREMLKDFLEQHCMLSNHEAKSQNGDACDEEPSLSAFDFLYLPIDFYTKSSKGYGFVNFTNPVAARKFYDEWHDTRWDCFKSNKIRQICCAKLQGIEQLVKHFERMGFPSEDFQPVRFNPARDGSKQSVEETVIGRVIGCSWGGLCHLLLEMDQKNRWRDPPSWDIY